MRACNLAKARKVKTNKQKQEICYLKQTVEELQEQVRDLHHRVIQLEISKKVGF